MSSTVHQLVQSQLRVVALCFLFTDVVGAARPVNEMVDLRPSDQGALPTDKIKLLTPQVSRTSITSNPFDEYVPGLRSRYALQLDPTFTLPHLHVPFLQRGRADDGRANFAVPEWLYVDLRLTADFIFTDNILCDNDNRKSDLVIQTVLTIDTTVQLTDDFKLQIAGNLVYHRALGEDSVSGFGFQDYFYFDDTFRVDNLLELNGNALFAAQAGWQRQFGEWDAQIGDRFYVANRVMGDPFVDNQVKESTETANIASGALGRLLPGPCRFGMAATHGNYWYDSHFKNYARSEDSATIWFDVRRETMRFQPFANYTVKHLDYTEREQDGFVQLANLGVRGPVTDLIKLEASVGYSYIDEAERTKTDEILWRLNIDHLMNSTTRHELLLERRLSPSADSLQSRCDTLRYKIGHKFTRDITAWLGVDKTMYDSESDNRRDTEKWSFLANTSFTPARRMKCDLEYQFTDWSSDRNDSDYTENRITLSVTWDI